MQRCAVGRDLMISSRGRGSSERVQGACSQAQMLFESVSYGFPRACATRREPGLWHWLPDLGLSWPVGRWQMGCLQTEKWGHGQMSVANTMRCHLS